MSLLTPYRVLDLTGPLGYYAGKLFADFGAEVIKLEPPDGDPGRNLPPLLAGDARTPLSLFWVAMNGNKRSISVDLHSAAGRGEFVRMIQTADFVFESFQPGTLDDLGIGPNRLFAENPRLVLVSITPFGQEGPYADFLASDLEIMALSGAMSLAGEENGEPMRVTAPQSPMWVGAEAAIGALTALAWRQTSGRGQWVDVSAQVAVIAALAHAPAFWDLNGVNPQRAGIYITGRSMTGAKMRALWPCKDGWLNFIIYGGAAGRHTNEQLVSWMAQAGMAPQWLAEFDWSEFQVSNATQEEIDRLESCIGTFLLTLTKKEFIDGVIARQVLGYPVSTVEDIYKDPQLTNRKFWHEIREPRTGTLLSVPGGFCIVNGQRLAIADSNQS